MERESHFHPALTGCILKNLYFCIQQTVNHGTEGSTEEF